MKTDKTRTRAMESGTGKPKKDEGFTLIEVLIAVSIFAIGLLAVAVMQTSAIKVNSSAAKITTSMTWAQDKMEELMALSYSDHQLEDLGDPPSGTDSQGELHQETSGNYTISWTVTDNNPLPGTKLITVTATGRGKIAEISYVKPDL
ncbi:MAG: prepilin-type N-terminal cleavage/methylation domain-containing protein [Desulfobacterales bacterium]|jgi:type IV pilus modification protein PilV